MGGGRARAPRAAYAVNKSRMVPLAEYSRDMLRELRAETGIAYDERSQGTLQLFRTQKLLDGAAKDVAVLEELGVPHELLERRGLHPRRAGARAGCGRSSSAACACPATRPATASSSRTRSRDLAPARGVEFRYGTTIDGLLADGGRITGVATDKGRSRATPTSWRSAATRRCSCAGSASTCRSTRSRATR